MTDLSQTEHTAMNEARAQERNLPSRPVDTIYEAGWIRGRDYGRERERALREALDAADWFITCLKNVVQRKVVRGLPEAEGGYYQLRGTALVASPGEPEGQPCKTCEGSGRILVSDGPATTPCPHCRDPRGRSMSQIIANAARIERQMADYWTQPYHGPEEPSDGLEPESIVENEDGLEDETI